MILNAEKIVKKIIKNNNYKTLFKQNVHEQDYVWNPCICACEIDKKCEIDRY